MRVRLYVPNAGIGKEIALTPDQIRHLKVLRLREGEKIGVFDGKGHEFEVVYSEKVSSGKIRLEKAIKPSQEPKIAITLAIAVPKGARMDLLVEKVSEIGVNRIVPIICSRSVVEPREQKIERLRRIAIEASAQSERSIVPTISELTEFAKILETAKQYNHAYICHKTGEPLAKVFDKCESLLLIVGPEGDFTEAEMQAAKEAGCTTITLGPTILRTETAGIVVAAQVIALSQQKSL